MGGCWDASGASSGVCVSGANGDPEHEKPRVESGEMTDGWTVNSDDDWGGGVGKRWSSSEDSSGGDAGRS